MADRIFAYLVIAHDGTSHECRHRMGDSVTIHDVFRATLGGWLEHIQVSDASLALWCDENHPSGQANVVGSRLVRLLGGPAAAYVGPIVVTGNHQDTAVSLTEEQIERLLDLLPSCR